MRPDDDAVLVAEIEKALVLGIVCPPHVVRSHLKKQGNVLLDLIQRQSRAGVWPHGVSVVPMELDDLPVQCQARGGLVDPHGAEPKADHNLVCHLIAGQQGDGKGVQVRRGWAPQRRVWYLQRERVLHDTVISVLCGSFLSYGLIHKHTNNN